MTPRITGDGRAHFAGPHVTIPAQHAIRAAYQEVEAAGGVAMWSLCERPCDAPDHYTARLFRTLPSREVTPHCLRAETLEGVILGVTVITGREWTFLPRHEDDDPAIVGTLL